MIRILHIEDDAVDRLAFKRELARQGDCIYESANSLKDARAALGTNTYDAIVTDYMLGDGTSIELMPIIARYPVVFTTATGAEEVAVTAMKMGAMDYLVKDPDRHYIKIIYAVINKAIAEFNLRRRVSTLSIAVESIGEAVCIVGTDETVIFVNAAFCQQYGYSEAELGGHRVTEIELFTGNPGFTGAADRKEGFAERSEHTRKNGQKFPVWLRYSPLSNREGQIQGSIWIITDVSQLAEKEASLIAARKEADLANRAKSEFLAAMSHEIRTPLNAILGYSDLLQENQTDIDRKTYLQRIVSAGQHLLTVVNEILDLAKIETGNVQLHENAFSFERMVQDVFDVLSIRAREKNLNFSIQIQAGGPVASVGDEALLKKVVYNLISNAIKFTAKGSVEVDLLHEIAKPGQTKFTVRIADSGIGVAAANREKIFEPFVQADSGIARQFGGTGLGLSICRKIVRMMGGDIIMESEVGEGSTFIFFVELKTDQGQAKVPAADAKVAVSSENADILFVDDSEDNQILMEVYFRNTRYKVDYAKSGAQALQFCGGKQYDLILMDVQMPEMDGYTATGKIRELSRGWAHRPIILACTANARPSDSEGSLAAGCDGHLTKPIRKQELLATIHRMLTQQKALT